MAYKIDCPTCKLHVNYVNLRIDKPKCEMGHSLGRWVMCKGKNGSHLFLSRDENETCPVCGDNNKVMAQKGIKVRCMKSYPDGKTCPTPEYTWLVEGPPCNLNHIDVIVVT